jgi:hypothetical protein
MKHYTHLKHEFAKGNINGVKPLTQKSHPMEQIKFNTNMQPDIEISV